MKRRASTLLAWSCCWLTAGMLAVPATSAVELRGRTGSRATHRLASLQADDYEQPTEEATEQAEPSMEAAEDVTPPASSLRSAPSRSYRQPPPGAMMSLGDPGWDAGVMHEGVVPGGGLSGGGLCSDGYCADCPSNGGCGLLGNGTWGSIEYVLWWRSARHSPPLVTTSTTATNQAVDARLGQANTRILLGDAQYTDHLQPGGRVDLGLWLNACQTYGVGLRFTALGDDNLNYTTNSNINRVLAVPFFNLDPTVNREDTLLVAHPLDATTGSITVTGHNEVTLGDIYLRMAGVRNERYQMDLIGGYFFSHVLEDLAIQTSTLSAGTRINVLDRFRTKNEYSAGTIGFMGTFNRGPWTVNTLAKVALGNVQETVIVDGITTIGGVPQAPLGGLLAQPSNSGTRTQDRFVAIPELGLNWMYNMGYGANLTVGYSLVYWSEAARPGSQIPHNIDPTQATAQPSPRLVSDDYLAHGLTFGLNWQY